MEIKEIICDAGKYTIADWKNLLVLGFTLVLYDYLPELQDFLPGTLTDFLVLFLLVILVFIEAGYTFRILEETVKGSQTPPNFNNIKDLILHGIKEIIVFISYIIIPFLLFLFLIVGVYPIDNSIGYMTIILVLFIFISIVSIFLQGVLLNMANNHGSLRSAFSFKIIFKKINRIGLKPLIFVYILTIIILYGIRWTLEDNLHSIPIIGDFITGMLIVPFLILFTTRILGLIDKPLES